MHRMEKSGKTLLCGALLAGLLAAMNSQAGTNTWTAIGPDGGSVSFIDTDALNHNIVYAGSRQGGLYKSTDGGATWALSINGIDGLRLIQAFASHHSTPGVLFLSAQIVDAAGSTTTDLFKSSNGGTTWTRSSTGLPTSAGQPVQRITIDETASNTVYVSGLLGVYKSTDGGATWAQRNTGIAGVPIGEFAICRSSPATLYAASADGGNVSVYKSTDGAATWTLVSSPGSGLLGALAVNPLNANTVYIGVLGGFPNADHVYKSTDGGATWVEHSAGLGNDDGTGTKLILHHPLANGYLLSTKTATGELYATTNGAVNWSNSSTGLANAYVTSLTYAPGLYEMYAGTSRGVFKSLDDGATWSATANASLRNTHIGALTIDPSNSAVLYAGVSSDSNVSSVSQGDRLGVGSRRVMKSSDSGQTWTEANSGLPNVQIAQIAVHPQAPTTLYAATHGGGIYKSVNGGTQWNASNTGLLGQLATGTVLLNPQDGNVLYTYISSGTPHVYKSTNAGANWSISDTGLTDIVQTFAIDPRSPNTLYAVTRPNAPVAVKLFKSIDGAASWTDITNALSTPFLYHLAPDPLNTGTVYAASITGVLKSTDGGATWSNIGTGVNGVPVRIAFDPVTPNTVYVGTGASSSGGVFKSTNGGTTWAALNTGLGVFREVSAMIVNPQDPATLYIGIQDNGVHHLRQVAPQPGVLQLSASAYSISEGGGSIAVVVRRTGGSDGAASAQVATSNGVATAGADYVATTQTVTWVAGDAADKTVAIQIVADSVTEPDKTFSITLSSATGASLGSPTTATVTIVDDDPAPSATTEGRLSGGGATGVHLLLPLLLLAMLRMRRRAFAPVAFAAAAMLPLSPAQAADTYFGVRAAASDSNVTSSELTANLQARGSNITADLDDSGTGESLFGGLWFSTNLGAELSYSQLGEYRVNVSGDLSNPAKIVNDTAYFLAPTGDAVSLVARFRTSFGQSRVSLMSRIGAAHWEGEVKLDAAGSRERKTRSGWALVGGVTVDTALTPSLHAAVGIDILRGDRNLMQRQWLLELSWWR